MQQRGAIGIIKLFCDGQCPHSAVTYMVIKIHLRPLLHRGVRSGKVLPAGISDFRSGKFSSVYLDAVINGRIHVALDDTVIDCVVRQVDDSGLAGFQEENILIFCPGQRSEAFFISDFFYRVLVSDEILITIRLSETMPYSFTIFFGRIPDLIREFNQTIGFAGCA